jgi:nucleoside-triphosphatase
VKHFYFLTGRPRIGKTSIILEVIRILQEAGYQVGGMISNEQLENRSRVGFVVRDIATEETGLLAHVDQPEGPKVGKYKVDLKGLNSVGVKSLVDAINISDVIVVDEIGPMELYSASFKEAVLESMQCGKPVLGTIHYRSKSPFILDIRGREDVEIIEVTMENREHIAEELSKSILGILI